MLDYFIEQGREKSLILLLSFVFLLIAGCAQLQLTATGSGADKPLPDNVAVWLREGDQSRITEQIRRESLLVKGQTRRERLFRGMEHLWKRFRYDRLLNEKMLTKTADQLFSENILGGCTDFALIETTFFRSLDIPARLILTVNTEWIKAYRENMFSMPEGHAFIEVYLEDRWYLVDSTFRLFYSEYEPERTCYPRGEFFCKKGVDFWEMGVYKIPSMSDTMRQCNMGYKEGTCKEPNYRKEKI